MIAGTPLSALAVERAHLDGEGSRPAELAAPLESSVEMRRADDQESADVLLALGERTVGHEDLTFPEPQDRRRARGCQPAVEHPSAGGLGVLNQGADITHDPL